jgi:hypothetical protein
VVDLAASPYSAGLRPNMQVSDVQRQVAATLLWNLRLIAGWVPPGGARMVQALAAWFEIANIEERLAYLAGEAHESPFELGRLAVAWPAVAAATTTVDIQLALAGSAWRSPPSSDANSIVMWLRFRWAEWVAVAVPQAATWAASASTLLAARAMFAEPGSLAAMPTHPYGLPPSWREAGSLAQLRAMTPRQTAWVLDGIPHVSELWRAEAAWWSRVRRDASEALVRSRFGADAVVAAVALLAHDAWITRAAVAAAARGSTGRSAFDAVA